MRGIFRKKVRMIEMLKFSCEKALLQLAVKSRAQYIDEYVMYYEKRMTAGRIAHHIIPIDERPDLALNPQNLIYVSDKTHKMIHDAYRKGGKEKAAMQEKLARIRIKKADE